MRKRMFCALLAPALLCACQQQAAAPAADTKAIADQIRQDEAQWVKDYAARDVGKAMAHYAPDAHLMPSGMKAMDDPKSIEAGLKGLIGDPNFHLDFAADKVEVAASGDIAYSRGTYRLTMSDPKTKQPITETGTYITTYKKQADGSWKAEDDMVAASG